MQEELFDKQIGHRLKLARKELKLNQAQVGGALGITQGAVSKIENGSQKIDAYMLSVLTGLYEININWLLTGIEPKHITDQGEAGPLDPDPEIAELMEGARRVLTSGNPIAFDALERNIRYFSHAIAAEKELQEMKDDVADIKRELAKLKKKKTDCETTPQEEQSPDEKAA